MDVPTFDVEFFDDFAPNTDADAPTEGASADVAAPDLVEMPQAEEGPGEVAAPVRSARAERRRAGREADGLITCRACGEPVHLESARVRLRWTHALLECPECSTEFRIRRRDAYRDIDPEFPWAFASYSTTVTTTPVAEPERRRRFWRKG